MDVLRVRSHSKNDKIYYITYEISYKVYKIFYKYMYDEYKISYIVYKICYIIYKTFYILNFIIYLICCIIYLIKYLRYLLYSIIKKYRYQVVKQKEQSQLKIQKTRLSNEIRCHKTLKNPLMNHNPECICILYLEWSIFW